MHFKKCFFIFSILLFFLSPFFALAQNTGFIYGNIKDKNNNPVEDVSISVLGLSLSPVYSDKNGNYEYKVPAEEDITIVWSHLNFSQERKSIKIHTDERLELTFSLKPGDKTQLKSVEIIDQHSRTSTNIRLNPKIVSYIPTASGDFNSILFSQPGVSNRNEMSSQYSVRGGNFDENLVYVNDVEINRPFLIRSGQQEGLSFVNPDMVSSILFSAGGFEAKYGDKMSSVLDIQYRRPRKFAGTASTSLSGANLTLEGASKDYRFTWLVGARQKSNKYVLGSLDNKGDYQPSFTDIQANLNYDVSDVWELSFLGNYASNKYQVIPSSRETNFGTVNQALRLKVYFDGQEIDNFETSTAALTARYHPNERLNLKFISSAFHSTENETFDIQGQYYIDALETDLGKSNFGDVRANLGVGTYLEHARNYLNSNVFNLEHKGSLSNGKNQLLWGTKFQTEFINDKLSEWKYIDSAGFSIPQASPSTIDLQDIVKTNTHLSSNRVTGYVENIWRKETSDTSEMTLTAGVRANYWNLNNQTVISPRVTYAYKPNWKSDVVFRTSSGYYYQPPFYRELRDFYGIIHTDVKAQKSIHFLIASDLNFKAWDRPFKFISEIYFKKLDQINPYEIDNVRLRYYANNNASGYATGIDMKVNGEFVNGIESWASLSLMRTMEDIKNDFYYEYFNSEGKKIVPGYTTNNIPVDSIKHEPGYIPRPTNQLVNFSLFFQDYLPRFPDFKMHLNLLFGTSIPFGPPSHERYKDILKMPPYRRVDIGFSYLLMKENQQLPDHNPFRFFKSVWLSMEVFNLLQTKNTISYTWIKDVTNRQYAIPNYLSGRLLNLKMIAKF